ncbi:MAG: four helix bundle protein [Oscillatoriaceae cyanobacterium Prado104]|nr:four helix bundle protein [Oscillatoriaceae cyanobacterium Prado104]
MTVVVTNCQLQTANFLRFALPTVNVCCQLKMTDNSPLKNKSFAFAVRIIDLHKYLCSRQQEYIMSKQLLRSGTAIGALVREAEQAESKADFIHKLAIALKEANETEYWILLLCETNYLTLQQGESILKDLKELLKLLTTIVKTTKQKLNAKI